MRRSAMASTVSTAIFHSAPLSVHSLQKRRPTVYPPKMVSAGQRVYLTPESNAGTKGGHRGNARILIRFVEDKPVKKRWKCPGNFKVLGG